MKRIVIILIGLISVAYGQSSPTSSKTRFVNGLYVGTKLDSYFAAADSNAIYWRADSVVMAKYKGTARALAFVGDPASGYVPYIGAVDNVALGNFRLTARSLKTDSIYANGSGGAVAVTNSGTKSFGWGDGGSSEVTFYGFAGYDANRSSSYTARSFTDKNYVDSSDALRVRYTDTAAMLSPYLRRTDSTGLLSQVVRTFGTQTIGGNKTFTNDIFASTARIGIGAGGNTSNAVLGYNVFTANTTGTKNTAMGENSLSSNVSATDNTAFGWYSLDATTGSGNTGIGSGALGTNTSGSNNTAIGFGAGEYITGSNPNTTGANSIFLGYNSKAAANGETNQIVIGHNATGNGSNTVTIGNSSVTDNYFTGTVRSNKLRATDTITVANLIPVYQFIGASGNRLASIRHNGSNLEFTVDSGANIFNDNITGTSLSMSGTGNFADALTLQDNLIFTNSLARMRIGATNFAIQKNDGSANYVVLDNATGNVTLSSLGTGTVYSNSGTLTNTDPSDSSIKNTINPHKYGLAEVLKLQPKSFYYNSDSTKASLKYGFIAQEVEKIMPDMVRKIDPKSDSSKLGLESQGIYVTMVKAIQEQQAIIEALLTRIKALEAKLN